jgi:hypothetical protein
MDSETLQRSQLYFARYRLSRQITDLIMPSEIQPDREGKPAPHTICTVEWFIAEYMDKIYKGSQGQEAQEAEMNLRELVAAHGHWIVRDQNPLRPKINVEAWRAWLRNYRKVRRIKTALNYFLPSTAK